jgi:hypothetical protein
VELDARQPVARHLAGHKSEIDRGAVEKVPGVRPEPVLEVIDETRRAEEVERAAPMQAQAQQAVEAGEVVHVGVRDERVAHLQELPRREGREVAEVEEQRPAIEEEVDVEPRIPERVVDQPGVEEGLHVIAAYRSTQ